MSTDPWSSEGLDIGLVAMVRDEPGYRIQLQVAPAGDPENTEFRLEVADRITWWKALVPFLGWGWWMIPIDGSRIETRDDVKGAEGFFQPHQLTAWGRFELWKAGFLGLGAFAARWDYNPWAQRGRKLVFRWLED